MSSIVQVSLLAAQIFMVGAGSKQAAEYASKLQKTEGVAVIGQVFNSKKPDLEIEGAKIIHPRNLMEELPGLLKETTAQTALISLPHNLLTKATMVALRAGIPFIVKEKPLALTVAELNLYAQYPNTKIFTLTQRGSSPVFLNAKANLHKIGQIEQFDFQYLASFGPPSGWRADREQTVGGATLDMGSHLFQVVAMLFEGMPEGIEAEFGYDHEVSKEQRLDDRVVATLRYPGFEGRVVVDRHAERKGESYLIQGAEGSMEIAKTGYVIKNREGEVIDRFALAEEEAKDLGNFLQQKTIEDFLSLNEAIYARNFDTNSRAVCMIEQVYAKGGNPLQNHH
jgi:predicted dehydrogenase